MLLAPDKNQSASYFAVSKDVPRTSKELEEIRKNALSQAEQYGLQKWARLFDKNGSMLPDIQSSQTESPAAVLSSFPSYELPEPPNTRTRIQGTSIKLETAQALRRILFGNATHTFGSDWKSFRFLFRDARSQIPYGLHSDSSGVRPLTLCVQAFVLKYLLFANNEEEDRQFGRAPPTPNCDEQEEALLNAFTDMLWRVSQPLDKNNEVNSDHKRAVVVLPSEAPVFKTPGFFLADGITEKLWLYSITKKSDLYTFLKRNMHYFCNRAQPGGILFVYSVVLSHSIDAVRDDLANCQESLLTENARATQAFINLLLTGYATCYIHNGCICYDKHGRLLDIPKPGPKKRSEVGFLFFDKSQPKNQKTEVGCMLRTPYLPIWMTQINGSYGLLFCTSKDLVADWKTERFFTIHYYTAHFSQTENTDITIDTRRRAVPDYEREISIWDDEEEKERKQPSLEHCLFTKWPEATIDWNGETPYY